MYTNQKNAPLLFLESLGYDVCRGNRTHFNPKIRLDKVTGIHNNKNPRKRGQRYEHSEVRESSDCKKGEIY